MEGKALEKKYRAFVSDSIWSMAGLVLLYAVQQFVLYPVIRKSLGAEEYGNVLFFMGVINILAVSVGSSANNSRLKSSIGKSDKSGIYDFFFCIAFGVFFTLTLLLLLFYRELSGMIQVILFWLLMCATSYRYYADVEYRITINYRGYFKYYVKISAGYLAGIIVFFITGVWQLAFLTGEMVSVVIMLMHKRSNVKKETYAKKDIKEIFSSIGVLLIAQVLANIVLNADRLILKVLVGSTAVTVYYVASLLGKTTALITTPLNSVILGYLAKRKEGMSLKIFIKIAGVVFLCSLGILGVYVLGSHIFVYLFYPQEYEAAANIFVLANIAQIFYFSSGIITTVLLRYTKESDQLYINIVYSVLCMSATIPATMTYGIQGFSIALCCVNIAKFLLAVLTGIMRLK